MKEIDELFDHLEEDSNAFQNFTMLLLTSLVNRGALSLHWDLSSQQFCFTVNSFEEVEFETEEEEYEFDPDEILRKMGVRENKKKNNGS